MSNNPRYLRNESVKASSVITYKEKKLPLEEIYFISMSEKIKELENRPKFHRYDSIPKSSDFNQKIINDKFSSLDKKNDSDITKNKEDKQIVKSQNKPNSFTKKEIFNQNNDNKNNDDSIINISYEDQQIENSPYAIELIDIYKSFNNGLIKANQGITLKVKKNSVHALVGENGAGKSVLMSILFGIYSPDNGHIKINGEIVNINSTKQASFYGLGMVHQHFKLVDSNTIYENIILGNEDCTKIGFMKHHDSKQKIKNLIDKYGFNLDINKKISKLNVAEQQKTEILKLLYRDANILIFDEPTAVLSQHEIQQFLNIVKRLKEEGKTIILITHKFNEIEQVADHATIIRRGKYISDYPINETNKDKMIIDMIGNELVEVTNNSSFISDNVVLDIKKLNLFGDYKNKSVSFKIHEGEILAIAGVTGNGQTELALSLAGVKKNNKDQIIINNEDISKKSIRNRYIAGLASVPEDRHKHAVILDMPTYMNIVLNDIENDKNSKYGFIKYNAIKTHSRQFIKTHDIRGTNNAESPIRNLSGGNQQKLVVGREIESKHKVLMLVQPTRGLDVLAINNIHKMIMEEKEKGKAILLISYELDEILSLADTIAVMSKGEIVTMKPANQISREEIGKAILGEVYEH